MNEFMELLNAIVIMTPLKLFTPGSDNEAVITFEPREPMPYESMHDYCFWRLHIYDHFS